MRLVIGRDYIKLCTGDRCRAIVRDGQLILLVVERRGRRRVVAAAPASIPLEAADVEEFEELWNKLARGGA